MALGYQYPSHMLLLLLVAAFCHLRISLKETNPCPSFPPPPPPPPPPKKTNKTKNHKSRKTIFLLTFWGWGGGGRVLTMEVQLYNNVGFFFPCIFYNQLDLDLHLQQMDQVSMSFFTS